MKPASGPPDTAPYLPKPMAHSPGGGPMHSDSPSPGLFSHFVPISEAVARVVGRVRRQREREFNDAELVARFPVSDPEDEAVAREFAEPET